MSTFKKYLSYFWDIPIERTGSEQNAVLEVSWSMGRKVLNSKNANYSFGNGYKVFEHSFKDLNIEPSTISDVLALGFGAGSVEHILREYYGWNGKLVGVEYDKEIIALYHRHFKTQYPCEIHHADAFEYVKTENNCYNLIVVDLFDDLKTVPFIYSAEFTNALINLLEPGGILIYNTVESESDKAGRMELLAHLSGHFKEVKVQEFQEINRIITAK